MNHSIITLGQHHIHTISSPKRLAAVFQAVLNQRTKEKMNGEVAAALVAVLTRQSRTEILSCLEGIPLSFACFDHYEIERDPWLIRYHQIINAEWDLRFEGVLGRFVSWSETLPTDTLEGHEVEFCYGAGTNPGMNRRVKILKTFHNGFAGIDLGKDENDSYRRFRIDRIDSLKVLS
jgi:hypothetical protein